MNWNDVWWQERFQNWKWNLTTCSLTLVSSVVRVGDKWGTNCYLLIRFTKITNFRVCAMGKWQHVANSCLWQRCDDGMAEIWRHMEWWLGWWGGHFMGSGDAMLMSMCEQWKWMNNLKIYLCDSLIYHKSYVIIMDTSQMQLTAPHVISSPSVLWSIQ